MVDYSDFILILVPAIAMQITALVYLFGIRKVLGKRASRLYGASNTLMLSYDALIAYLLAVRIAQPDAQPIELWGLFMAFAFPIGMGILNIFQQRDMYRAMTPNTKKRFHWW